MFFPYFSFITRLLVSKLKRPVSSQRLKKFKWKKMHCQKTGQFFCFCWVQNILQFNWFFPRLKSEGWLKPFHFPFFVTIDRIFSLRRIFKNHFHSEWIMVFLSRVYLFIYLFFFKTKYKESYMVLQTVTNRN